MSLQNWVASVDCKGGSKRCAGQVGPIGSQHFAVSNILREAECACTNLN